MHTLRTLALGALAALALGHAAGAAELVMVEQRGCLYCKMWHQDVGPEEYARTAEGAFAQLRRIDLHEPRPGDIAFASPLRITPTFVLVDEGRELARMEGYPGEDFFWGLLGMMLKAHTDYDEGGTG
jgi:thioredoxin-related protein